MKHSKKYYPEFAFLIKNLSKVSVPSKNYRVDFDGIDTLIKNEKMIIKYDYEFNNSNHGKKE